MNKHHKINYIEFFAEDLEIVKVFYKKAFGWEFTDYGPTYTAFSDGTLDGGFAKGPSSKEGGSLVILYSDKLEESLEAVKRHGAAISKEIFSFPGGRRFHFKDPAGNELAIWSDS